MKKRWPLILLIALLVIGYIVVVWNWYMGLPEKPRPTVPAATTAATTAVTTQTTAAPTTAAPTTQPETQATTAPETEPTTEPTTVPTTEAPLIPADDHKIHGTAAFVYDLTNEKLLYTKGDQTAQVAPASLTKLLTALMVLEHLDPERVITADVETSWAAAGSSVAAVYPGNQLTVEMLLQGMLMQSGNDAAYVLAVAIGKQIAGDKHMESVDAYAVFLEALEQKRQALGLEGSAFLNPDGYDQSGHYSTPADLMKLAILAAKEPLICKYSSMHRQHVVYVSGQDYVWENTNKLLDPNSPYYCEEAFGLKTGSTEGAAYCLIAAFERDGRTLLVGVLGCLGPLYRFEDALYLYNHYIAQ